MKKSFAALAELKPGRYGKTEIMGASFDALVPAAAAGAGAAAAHRDSCRSHRARGPESAGRAAPPRRRTSDPEAAGARQHRVHARAHAHARRDPTQAILEMQVLTQSYPDLPGPYANLGILYRNANQLAESEAALAKATERAPWDAQTWTEYGLTLRQAGKFAEARAAYERAIKANPSYAPAHRNLGVLLDLFLDDPLTAQAELETYKTLTGEDKPVSGWLAELERATRCARPRPKPRPKPKPNATEHRAQAPRRRLMNKLLFLALLLLAGAALAQTPRRRRPRDSMEPGVNTSAPARRRRAMGRASTAAPAAAPAPAAPPRLTNPPRRQPRRPTRATPRTAWTSIPRRSPATANCPRCCTSCPGAVRSSATSWGAR